MAAPNLLPGTRIDCQRAGLRPCRAGPAGPSVGFPGGLFHFDPRNQVTGVSGILSRPQIKRFDFRGIRLDLRIQWISFLNSLDSDQEAFILDLESSLSDLAALRGEIESSGFQVRYSGLYRRNDFTETRKRWFWIPNTEIRTGIGWIRNPERRLRSTEPVNANPDENAYKFRRIASADEVGGSLLTTSVAMWTMAPLQS